MRTIIKSASTEVVVIHQRAAAGILPSSRHAAAVIRFRSLANNWQSPLLVVSNTGNITGNRPYEAHGDISYALRVADLFSTGLLWVNPEGTLQAQLDCCVSYSEELALRGEGAAVERAALWAEVLSAGWFSTPPAMPMESTVAYELANDVRSYLPCHTVEAAESASSAVAAIERLAALLPYRA
jgi:hypothetical protein